MREKDGRGRQNMADRDRAGEVNAEGDTETEMQDWCQANNLSLKYRRVRHLELNCELRNEEKKSEETRIEQICSFSNKRFLLLAAISLFFL